MSKKPPPNCRYYYEDYFRGQETKECRLPRSTQSRPWKRSICDSCPVPQLLRETNCPHLALEGTIRKRFPFGERMEVFAICAKHMEHLPDGRTCTACQAEQDALLDLDA